MSLIDMASTVVTLADLPAEKINELNADPLIRGHFLAQLTGKEVRHFCSEVFNCSPEQLAVAYYGMLNLLTKDNEE